MRVLTEDAKLVCKHEKGIVKIEATQDLVKISQRRILVDSNPEGCSIDGCPMYGPAIKPCKVTLSVKEGYSNLLRIKGRRICLEIIWGLTDGTPPGTVRYEVRQPGQQLVNQLP